MINRLKEVRKKLQLTQAHTAEAAGVTRETWGRYESGKLPVTVKALCVLAERGGDVHYILTGEPTPVLNADEKELLMLFRSSSVTGKAAAIGALQGASAKSIVANSRGGFAIAGGNTSIKIGKVHNYKDDNDN